MMLWRCVIIAKDIIMMLLGADIREKQDKRILSQFFAKTVNISSKKMFDFPM